MLEGHRTLHSRIRIFKAAGVAGRKDALVSFHQDLRWVKAMLRYRGLCTGSSSPRQLEAHDLEEVLMEHRGVLFPKG